MLMPYRISKVKTGRSTEIKKQTMNQRHLADPRAPQQGSSAMWVGHGRAPQTQGLVHPMVEPQLRAGDPLLGPRRPVLATSFDVSRCLEGQTTFESYETRTVA